ncbi:hypothetical protein C8Q77DRAFT_1132827 [Trametes polyzona]|nr:hypothetical protein C8Q77DRAFT_1132827 [Trametes polyzona]
MVCMDVRRPAGACRASPSLCALLHGYIACRNRPKWPSCPKAWRPSCSTSTVPRVEWTIIPYRAWARLPPFTFIFQWCPNFTLACDLPKRTSDSYEYVASIITSMSRGCNRLPGLRSMQPSTGMYCPEHRTKPRDALSSG